MRDAGRSGRGERARVARRVRAVLGADPEAGGVGAAFDPGLSELPGLGLGEHPDPGLGEPPGPLRWEPMAAAELPSGSAQGGRRAGPFAVPLPARVRQHLRLDPGRRGAVAVGVAALAAAVVTTAWVRAAHPHNLPVVDAGLPSQASVAGGAAPSVAGVRPGGPSWGPSSARPTATGPPIVVDVIGRVRRPGLYTLPAGARVYDAIKAAGGAVRGVNLNTLNLAARVSDGQQIAVGTIGAGPPGAGAPVPAGGGGSGGGGSASGPVNLNTATLEQLDALPGVGPVLAQHILDWRTSHGSFGSVDQLREVSGIGTVKFAGLRSLVTV